MRVNNYIKTLINQMAKATQTVLTERHHEILSFAHFYYEKNKVGPLYLNLKKNINATKEEIERLFPNGLNSVYTWVEIPIQTPDQTCKPLASVKVADYKEVYLDHNATTYVRPEVAGILADYYQGEYGFENPSSSTQQGRKAFNLIQKARNKIAATLKVSEDEIYFTSCGTEANNLAIKGIAFSYLNQKSKSHIITSKIEHPSVLKTMQYLQSLGFEVDYLNADSDGLIDPDLVEQKIRKNTILVAIMAVNNEIGTINPIEEIGRICRRKEIPFFVDAIQAYGKRDIFPDQAGISLLSLSGHKIYAPKGVGVLYVNKNISLMPQIHGGGQESYLRPGTENVGHIIALGKAAELICREKEIEWQRLKGLQNLFIEQLSQIEEDFIINGSLVQRVPNNLSVGFKGIDSGALLLSLNSIGICVSAGSACSSGKFETSHVLTAIQSDVEHYGTLRFSFGLRTTRQDILYLFQYLPEILRQIREYEAE